MKKALFVLSLIAGLGSTITGFTISGSHKQSARVFAESGTNVYMPFETSFNDYSGFGNLREVNATTWSGRFNALDKFFSGEGYASEEVTGTFDSVSWEQKLDFPYVYFTWAGNADNAVEIRKVSDPNAATPVARITNDQFNGNPMVVNYIKIDTTSLTEGEELFLRLCDNSTSGYGFNTFGYLHVNASASDVSDAIWTHINSLTTDYDAGNSEVHFRIHQTMDFYLNGKAKTDNILNLSSLKNISVDEDFEDNATFLQKWYRDTTYDEGFNDPTKSWSTIISSADHHHNNNNLPFNKTGNGFFKGYFENDTGFIATDNAKYRFMSKPFVLSGTGFVSIKMAGRPASLHIKQGNANLAYIDIKSFKTADTDAANITTGFNSCTLVRHVINLSAFLGQTIQIAIADVDTGGDWGATNYDELITKYDVNPTFKVDEAIQNSIHNYYLDKYVSSANTDIIYVDEAVATAHASDTSVVKEAHDFLDYYYSNFRVAGSAFSFCNVESEVKNTLVSNYSNLSAAAQAIVNGSEDFDFGDERTTGNWYDYSMRKQYTVGYIVQYIAARYGIAIDVKNSGSLLGLNIKTLANQTPIIVASSVILALVVGLFFVLKAKKRKETDK